MRTGPERKEDEEQKLTREHGRSAILISNFVWSSSAWRSSSVHSLKYQFRHHVAQSISSVAAPDALIILH